MTYEYLNGRRCICLVRCSTAEQADTSIPDQLKLLRAFAGDNGMTCVDEVVLDGVSGSLPGARTDIEAVLERKRERDDFDVLLVQDMSRLTRGGAHHGMKLEYDLNAAGIDVVFASEPMPEGDHGGIIKSVGFYAAKQYARSLSFAVARGLMSSLQDGRIAHCVKPPYGIDRLYVTADGRPLHVVRNQPDGTQQKLDPTTNAVLETYPRALRKGRSNRYRKQGGERLLLIPGADEQVELVRQIYRRHYLDGWGGYRIAMQLNKQGVPAAGGRPWCVSSVQHVLRNTVYTGVGIANRYTQAIYHERSPNAPKATKTDRRALATRKKPPQRVRPRADWVEIDHPALAEFLEPQVRELARVAQAAYWANRASGGTPRGGNKDRHADSDFVLKGVLRSKQGGHAMSGRGTGRRKPRLRYYGINRTIRIPTADKVLRRLVPAEPIERAVLGAVTEVLTHTPRLRELVERTVREQLNATARDGAVLEQLVAERERLREQVEFVIDSVGALSRQVAKAKVDQLEAQLRALNERIVKATAAAAGATVNVGVAVQVIMDRLYDMAANLHDLPPSLRRLLSILVSRLEVDLETRTFEMELALPLWAAFDDAAYEKAMCLEDKSAQVRPIFSISPLSFMRRVEWKGGYCAMGAGLHFDRRRLIEPLSSAPPIGRSAQPRLASPSRFR